MDQTPDKRDACQPDAFDWIAHQNPMLANKPWHIIAAEAGAIVANDILDRVCVHIYEDFEDAERPWHARVLVDGYTDCEGEEIPGFHIDGLLAEIDGGRGHPEDRESTERLVVTLRRHADRLEEELRCHPVFPEGDRTVIALVAGTAPA